MVKSGKWTERYFARRLRTERQRRGWTQNELQERLGGLLHVTTIAKIEKGTRPVRIHEAALIADVLEISVDSMLGRKVHRDDDVEYALGAYLESAQYASTQLASIRNVLSQRFAELAGLQSEGELEELREVAARVDGAFRVAADGLERIKLYRSGEPLPKGDVRKVYADRMREMLMAAAADAARPEAVKEGEK